MIARLAVIVGIALLMVLAWSISPFRAKPIMRQELAIPDGIDKEWAHCALDLLAERATPLEVLEGEEHSMVVRVGQRLLRGNFVQLTYINGELTALDNKGTLLSVPSGCQGK